jgi:hypothetical protein
MLRAFKSAFDASLFTDVVVRSKASKDLERFDRELSAASAELAAGRPLSALATLRIGFNHLILAFHWSHRILPRSQNRTDSILREHCHRLGRHDFYALFRAVYALDERRDRSLSELIDACRADVDRIAALAGPAAVDFFRYAVDGNFQWGEDDGILTVHRLCLPLFVRAYEKKPFEYDEAAWQAAHAALATFLGLEARHADDMPELLRRARELRSRDLSRPTQPPTRHSSA